MKALTEYGKIVRHYRIDNQILLADMAKRLDLSPAYLSSIETGNRAIPPDLTEKLCAAYNLDEQTRINLMKAEAAEKKAVTIKIESESEESIDALVKFAREVQNYSVAEIRALYNRMKGGKDA